VLVAAGGSATTDGGAGAIEALEARGGADGIELEVLCDTSVPFEEAARVFAPQKGADDAAVARLSELLTARAGAFPRDPRGRAMTGAAGGLAGGLWAAFGARLVPGAAHVLGVLRFDRALEDIGRGGAVISGEGRVDAQTLEGKLVGEVARRCRAAGVPLHVVAGEVAVAGGDRERLGAASVRSAGTPAELEAAGRELAGG
jgi:glycerate kinase